MLLFSTLYRSNPLALVLLLATTVAGNYNSDSPKSSQCTPITLTSTSTATTTATVTGSTRTTTVIVGSASKKQYLARNYPNTPPVYSTSPAVSTLHYRTSLPTTTPTPQSEVIVVCPTATIVTITTSTKTIVTTPLVTTTLDLGPLKSPPVPTSSQQSGGTSVAPPPIPETQSALIPSFTIHPSPVTPSPPLASSIGPLPTASDLIFPSPNPPGGSSPAPPPPPQGEPTLYSSGSVIVAPTFVPGPLQTPPPDTPLPPVIPDPPVFNPNSTPPDIPQPTPDVPQPVVTPSPTSDIASPPTPDVSLPVIPASGSFDVSFSTTSLSEPGTSLPVVPLPGVSTPVVSLPPGVPTTLLSSPGPLISSPATPVNGTTVNASPSATSSQQAQFTGAAPRKEVAFVKSTAMGLLGVVIAWM